MPHLQKAPAKVNAEMFSGFLFVAYGKMIADLAFASSNFIQYYMMTDLGSLESRLLTPILQI